MAATYVTSLPKSIKFFGSKRKQMTVSSRCIIEFVITRRLLKEYFGYFQVICNNVKVLQKYKNQNHKVVCKDVYTWI